MVHLNFSPHLLQGLGFSGSEKNPEIRVVSDLISGSREKTGNHIHKQQKLNATTIIILVCYNLHWAHNFAIEPYAQKINKW